MKNICALLLVLLLFVSVSSLQNASAQATARTDVYHVHFAKATLGKGAEEGDFLKKQGPNAPCRDTTSFFAIKVARTGTTLSSSTSELRRLSMLQGHPHRLLPVVST